MLESKERIYARVEPEILRTIDELAEKQKSNRSEVLNFLLRRAIQDGYGRGLRFMLVNELRTNHAGKKYTPSELEQITIELQSRVDFMNVLIVGLLEERRGE